MTYIWYNKSMMQLRLRTQGKYGFIGTELIQPVRGIALMVQQTGILRIYAGIAQ